MFLFPGEDISIVYSEKLSSLWVHAKKVWDLSLSLIPDGIHFPGDGGMVRFTAGCHAKQIRLAKASYMQIERGLALESMLSARAMFELVVHLNFFKASADRARTASKFVLWQLMNNEKMLRLSKGSESTSEQWKNTLEKYVQQIEKRKKEFSEIDSWDVFKKCGPSLQPVEQLARNQNEENAYNQIYRFGSQVMHSSDSYHYATPSSNNEVQLHLLPTDEWSGPALAAVISMQWKTLQIVDEIFDLGRSKEINMLFEIPVPEGKNK